jgi:hypothetical protein
MGRTVQQIFVDLEKKPWTSADKRHSDADAAVYNRAVLCQYGHIQAFRKQVIKQLLVQAELKVAEASA